jgi:MarR family transcriptional regulator, organic hydroperoxide resistance regulator
MPTSAARRPSTPAGPRRPRPSLAATVRAVQIAYPQIYLACHTRHTRARSTAFRLSARDSSLLVHLDAHEPTRPATLARHMSIGGPTLSAAVRRLEQLGYLTRQTADADRRGVELRLTAKGAEALSATSVLETSRVEALLRSLSPADRARAVDGLSLLGRAARALSTRVTR